MNKTKMENILIELCKNLDISKTQYDQAVRSYTAVGNWLAHEDSALSEFYPDIFPQGSFLLGTIIKPINPDDELDIDLVCRLSGKNPEWTQKALKDIVGMRLKSNSKYKEMLGKEGRRCWTLQYSDSSRFHLDILPSLLSEGYKIHFEKSLRELKYVKFDSLALRITDRNIENFNLETSPENWPKSNPFGFAAWYKTRENLLPSRGMLLEKSIQDVPSYEEEKSVLTRVVQILKRHRDVKFANDPDKPISIIITTVAAKAYGGESEIYSALTNIINRIPDQIEEKFDFRLNKLIKWIPNPVNPEENFADKWSENGTKQIKFYQWIELLKKDFNSLLNLRELDEVKESLNSFLRFQLNRCQNLGTVSTKTDLKNKPRSLIEEILNVAHRQKPKWPYELYGDVKILVKFKLDTVWEHPDLNNQILPKGKDLYFFAKTNVEPPFEVYWQVVNTGNEAAAAKSLRGEIKPSKTAGIGGLKQKESTLYSGTHWIECFIVKNAVCVAKSGEFIVKIA